MTQSYYIYYRVTGDAAEKVRAAVTRLQQALAAETGVSGRLLCRRDKPETWMEVYEGVDDGAAFEAVLQRKLLELRFADLLGPDSPRRTEVFRPL